MLDGVFSGISDFFKNIFIGFLNLLPDLNFTIPNDVINNVCDFFQFVGYVFPIKALLPIVFFSLGLALFRFVWAIILRIKSFIPTMGD